MGNAVVYFDVNSTGGEVLKRFYAELFGWGLTEVPGNYAMVDTRGGTGINGGIGTVTHDPTPLTFYVEADDLRAVLDKAESLGGKTTIPVTEIPNMVTYAMFADPDGLLVGLVKTGSAGIERLGGPSEGGGVAVDWFEVIGSDAKQTQTFYSELFGWKLDHTMAPGYALVDTESGGRGIGGGIGAGGGAIWITVYTNVQSVETVLAKAEKLGGTREYGPNQVDDHMQTGAFRDPGGNVFGVYSHPPHD